MRFEEQNEKPVRCVSLGSSQIIRSVSDLKMSHPFVHHSPPLVSTWG